MPDQSSSQTVIEVSAVVFFDADRRMLTVRKCGTELFMHPGGKPEPGGGAQSTLPCGRWQRSWAFVCSRPSSRSWGPLFPTPPMNQMLWSRLICLSIAQGIRRRMRRRLFLNPLRKSLSCVGWTFLRVLSCRGTSRRWWRRQCCRFMGGASWAELGLAFASTDKVLMWTKDNQTLMI